MPNAVSKARRVAARRGRRLRIMFADEARFGRINRIRPCQSAGSGSSSVASSDLLEQPIEMQAQVLNSATTQNVATA